MITRSTVGLALSLGFLAAWPAHSKSVTCTRYFASAARVDIHVERRADQPPALQSAVEAYLRTLTSGEPGHVMTAQAEAIARTWSWLVTVEPGVASEPRATPVRPRLATAAQAFGLAELHDWQGLWWRAVASENAVSQLSTLTIGWRELAREASRLEAALPQPARGTADADFLAASIGPNFLRRADGLTSAVPELILLPDSDSYSIRDLNDLSPFPVYIVGFINVITRGDNRNWWPLGYPFHDLVHARSAFDQHFALAIANLSNGKWTRARFVRYVVARARVYGAFRRMVESRRSATEKTALDLVWYQMFHEETTHQMSGQGISRAISGTNYDAVSLPARTLSGRVSERLSSGFYGSEPEIQRLRPEDVWRAIGLLRAFAETQNGSNADASLYN